MRANCDFRHGASGSCGHGRLRAPNRLEQGLKIAHAEEFEHPHAQDVDQCEEARKTSKEDENEKPLVL